MRYLVVSLVGRYDDHPLANPQYQIVEVNGPAPSAVEELLLWTAKVEGLCVDRRSSQIPGSDSVVGGYLVLRYGSVDSWTPLEQQYMLPSVRKDEDDVTEYLLDKKTADSNCESDWFAAYGLAQNLREHPEWWSSDLATYLTHIQRRASEDKKQIAENTQWVKIKESDAGDLIVSDILALRNTDFVIDEQMNASLV